MTVFTMTRAERAGRQRRAVGELATILDAHRDLPIIGWTIGTAGAMLVGHVAVLASEAQIRQVFDVWRTALMLTEHSECTVAGGTTHLRAETCRARVRVTLTATLMATVAADPGGDAS